jgi:hypothetical protein
LRVALAADAGEDGADAALERKPMHKPHLGPEPSAETARAIAELAERSQRVAQRFLEHQAAGDGFQIPDLRSSVKRSPSCRGRCSPIPAS